MDGAGEDAPLRLFPFFPAGAGGAICWPIARNLAGLIAGFSRARAPRRIEIVNDAPSLAC